MSVTDELLRNTWRQVQALQSRRIAHRRLAGDAILVDRSGAVILTDLRGGEIAASTLLLRMDVVIESAQATLPMQIYLSDYRPAGGIKVPFVTRQRLGGIAEIVMTITDIQTNVPVDDALFARPAAEPAPAAAPSPATGEGGQ